MKGRQYDILNAGEGFTGGPFAPALLASGAAMAD